VFLWQDATVVPSLTQALTQEAAPAAPSSSEKDSGLVARPVSAAAAVSRVEAAAVWPPAVAGVPGPDTPTLKQYLTALFPANQPGADQQAFAALSGSLPLGQPSASASAVGYAAAAMPPLATWQQADTSVGLKKEAAYASPTAAPVSTGASATPAPAVQSSSTAMKKRAGRQEVIEATKICAPVQPKDIRNLDRRLPAQPDGSYPPLICPCPHGTGVGVCDVGDVARKRRQTAVCGH